ncbi:hypothetical protein [Tichowtungia aerotolerans]|uniref:AMIN domain-containing protein n=1 Tax=Tichowtungia aerotolerans TaxID=2697043 RepID=A0A6P1M444_9BACT|nr:hypothetical protein [Tichowtungia aerotolerans]QHI68607.1 hypothetical protein GT409_03795 [Tichowtungia aerotolerans]
MKYLKTVISLLIAGSAFAEDPKITCEPHELRGLPGEPLQVRVTVETDRVAPIQLRIPAVSNLVLHTVEKIPVRRTEKGHYVQQRIIIWQGIESGQTSITNLSVVFQTLEKPDPKTPTPAKEKGALTLPVPGIEITIDGVKPAEPPKTAEEEK